MGLGGRDSSVDAAAAGDGGAESDDAAEETGRCVTGGFKSAGIAGRDDERERELQDEDAEAPHEIRQWAIATGSGATGTTGRHVMGPWKTWKEWSLPEKSSEFKYRDGDNIGSKSDEFPEVGYQENPEKE